MEREALGSRVPVGLPTPRESGTVHGAYDGSRPEIVALVPPSARRVLDLGCSSGQLGSALASRGKDVVGVESDPELAALARPRLDRVVSDDLEALAHADADLGGPFDCIIAADVLEHLRDPWSVVRWAATMLGADGVMVVSVPNVRHIGTIWSLVARRRWPYEDVGIFDRTHLRWFARANLPELFEGSGLTIQSVGRVPRLRPHPSRWNRLARWMADWGTFQFLVVAARSS